MGSGEKMPFSRYPKVLMVMAHIEEILFIFILGTSSIRKVYDLVRLTYRREKILHKGDKTFLIEIHSRGIVMKGLRDNDIAKMAKLATIIFIVCYERVYCGL